MSRKFVVLLSFLITLILAGVSFFWYIGQQRFIKINYDNCQSATISYEYNKKVQSKKINSPSTISIPKTAKNVVAECKPSDGFASTNITDVGSEVFLQPDFSESKRELISKNNSAKILDAIYQKYPKLRDYKVVKQSVYGRGLWYVATFDAKEYDYNSDRLRIIIKQEDSGFNVVSKPEIIFTKYQYPLIPRDVLLQANNL